MSKKYFRDKSGESLMYIVYHLLQLEIEKNQDCRDQACRFLLSPIHSLRRKEQLVIYFWAKKERSGDHLFNSMVFFNKFICNRKLVPSGLFCCPLTCWCWKDIPNYKVRVGSSRRDHNAPRR